MPDLLYPWQRADICAGLSWIIRAEDALRLIDSGVQPEGPEGEWLLVDLTNAVHLVVDDTFWDIRDPAESIGITLRDTQEAERIREAVRVLCLVLDEIGPCEPDWAYLQHPQWPNVVEASQLALELLVTNDSVNGP